MAIDLEVGLFSKAVHTFRQSISSGFDLRRVPVAERAGSDTVHPPAFAMLARIDETGRFSSELGREVVTRVVETPRGLMDSQMVRFTVQTPSVEDLSVRLIPFLCRAQRPLIPDEDIHGEIVADPDGGLRVSLVDGDILLHMENVPDQGVLVVSALPVERTGVITIQEHQRWERLSKARMNMFKWFRGLEDPHYATLLHYWK